MDNNLIKAGKYKGRSFKYIFKNDQSYCNWISRTEVNNNNLKEFRNYLKTKKRKNKPLKINKEKEKYYMKNNIPSKILSRFWSTTDNYGENENYNSVGKWLIFCNQIDEDNNNLTDLDRSFQKINNHKILLAKSSTKNKNGTQSDEFEGVICIYTKEEDKYDVLNELKLLFKNSGKRTLYKYNQQTRLNQYTAQGSKNISSEIVYF